MMERKSSLWKQALRSNHDSSKSSANDSFSSARSQNNSFNKFHPQRPSNSPQLSFFAKNTSISTIFPHKRSLREHSVQAKCPNEGTTKILAGLQDEIQKMGLNRWRLKQVLHEVSMYKKTIRDLVDSFTRQLSSFKIEWEWSFRRALQAEFHYQSETVTRLNEAIILKDQELENIAIRNQLLERKVKELQIKLQFCSMKQDKSERRKIRQKQQRLKQRQQRLKQLEQRITLSTIKDGNEAQPSRTLKKISINNDLLLFQGGLHEVGVLRENISKMKELLG